MQNQILEAIERLEAKLDKLLAGKQPTRSRSESKGPSEGECKKCGATILWAKTFKGSNMALNLPPDPNGDRKLVDGIAGNFKAEYDPPDVARYTCHFDTCGKDLPTEAPSQPTVDALDDIPF